MAASRWPPLAAGADHESARSRGPVYQAGTLSGNPLAVTAGMTTLQLLGRRGVYEKLENKGQYLEGAFKKTLEAITSKLPLTAIGSMLTIFFGVDRVRMPMRQEGDRQQFVRFFNGMLARGIYLPPSPFETIFISLAHGRAELNVPLTHLTLGRVRKDMRRAFS